MVSKRLLQELKQIIKDEYGVELKPKKVSGVGNVLVRFFELLREVDNEGYKTRKETML